MIPKNFSKENFLPARAASLFHCIVWWNLDKDENTHYTSWRNELYQVNARMKVISHPSAFKALKDMLLNFADKAQPKYRQFARAEIYENFFGTLLYIHDGVKEIKENETFKPLYITRTDLKQPGKHRLIDGFESQQFGKIGVEPEDVKKHIINNWLYYSINYKRREEVMYAKN